MDTMIPIMVPRRVVSPQTRSGGRLPEEGTDKFKQDWIDKTMSLKPSTGKEQNSQSESPSKEDD